MSRILILDADLEVRDLCYSIMTAEGHAVTLASTGAHALKVLQLHETDILIMELALPDRNGLEFFNQLRSEYRRLPIIVFSKMLNRDLQKTLHESGAIDVFSKKMGEEALSETIKKMTAALHRVFGNPSEQKKESILIVDDDADMRRLLREYFLLNGFISDEASSGEQALVFVKKHQPHIVLLDVIMPGMDGLATLKKIRELSPRTEVVMATGIKDENLAQKAMNSGAYGYVVKPFELDYLDRLLLALRVTTQPQN